MILESLLSCLPFANNCPESFLHQTYFCYLLTFLPLNETFEFGTFVNSCKFFLTERSDKTSNVFSKNYFCVNFKILFGYLPSSNKRLVLYFPLVFVMKSSRKHRDELHVIESASSIQGSSSTVTRSTRSRKIARVDDKVLFERLWKGTFRAIVAASLQGRDKKSIPLATRRGTLRSVIRSVFFIFH